VDDAVRQLAMTCSRRCMRPTASAWPPPRSMCTSVARDRRQRERNDRRWCSSIRRSERRGPRDVEEGCLSVPGIYDKVQRATKIRVRALGRDGKPFELDAEGLLAVCIQHEIDHLEGQMFVDYLSELKRQLIRKRLRRSAGSALGARRARPRRLSNALDFASSSLRLAFAGTPPFAVPALDALCAAGHRVHSRAVFTQADRPAGAAAACMRARSSSAPSNSGFRCISRRVSRRRGAGLARAIWHRRIRRGGLRADLAAAGARGAAPRLLQHSRLAAAALARRGADSARDPRRRCVTGVTIMRMEEGLDTGPMLLARAIDIDERDTRRRCTIVWRNSAASWSVEALDGLQRGTARGKPQPAEGVCYAAKIEKSEALIDWREDAEAIARKVRAFNPRPVAETRFEGAQLRIWEAEVRPRTRRAAAERGARNRAGGIARGASTSPAGVGCCASRGCSCRPQADARRSGSSPMRAALAAHDSEPMNAAAGARARAAYVVARIVREGVTLDAALHDALANVPAAFAPAVRSLSYGAVRGYYRHEAILGPLAVPAGPIARRPGARDPVGRAVRTGGCADAGLRGRRCGRGDREGDRRGARERTHQRGAAPLFARARRNRRRDRAQSRDPPCLAGLARGSSARRLAGALDAAAGRRRRPGADVAADQQPARGRAKRICSAAAAGIGARTEPRVPFAVVLDAPCDVHDLPGFAQGEVSVQDLGAQCVAFPLGLAPGQRVLDACAAPGRQDRLIAEREPDSNNS
jgi:methionyl-tRNA formyltransferase